MLLATLTAAAEQHLVQQLPAKSRQQQLLSLRKR
jgi:hypothetical protein